jgi:hypothetical protein
MSEQIERRHVRLFRMQHSEGAFVHRLRLRPVICRQALPCYYPAFAGLLINLFSTWFSDQMGALGYQMTSQLNGNSVFVTK